MPCPFKTVHEHALLCCIARAGICHMTGHSEANTVWCSSTRDISDVAIHQAAIKKAEGAEIASSEGGDTAIAESWPEVRPASCISQEVQLIISPADSVSYILLLCKCTGLLRTAWSSC